MMLFRRLSKRGFRSRNEKNPYQIVNVGSLNKFSKGATVSPDNLFDEGLIKDKEGLVKLLGDGALSKSLNIKVHKATGSALKKVQDASGTVEILAGRVAPPAPRSGKKREAQKK